MVLVRDKKIHLNELDSFDIAIHLTLQVNNSSYDVIFFHTHI